METFNRLIPIAYAQPEQHILMTPLNGATFSKNSAVEITALTGLLTPEILMMMNSSCRSGGHYLPFSDMAVAGVASTTATKGVKDANVKTSIISKTLKQNKNVGKDFRRETFLLYSRYATGSLPGNLDPMKLIDEYNLEQTTRLQLLRAASQTKTQVNIAILSRQPPKDPNCQPPPNGGQQIIDHTTPKKATQESTSSDKDKSGTKSTGSDSKSPQETPTKKKRQEPPAVDTTQAPEQQQPAVEQTPLAQQQVEPVQPVAPAQPIDEPMVIDIPELEKKVWAKEVEAELG